MSSESYPSTSSCSSSDSVDSDDRTSTVSFGTVSTYVFPVVMGDNPAVREGCPVALGKKCIDKSVMDLSTHEMMARVAAATKDSGSGSQKQNLYRPRRGKELYIPVSDRASLLLAQGYQLDDIVQTVMAVEETKKQRAESLKMSGWQKVKGVMDASGKTLRNVLSNNNNGSSNNGKAVAKSAPTKPNTVQARSA